MKIFTTIKELREDLAKARAAGQAIGLVPTMGALHAGHGSLIQKACEENEYVVVSNFVNPTQFGPNEDLEAYPRSLEEDCRLAADIGAQAVFAPAVCEMYPEPQRGDGPPQIEGDLSGVSATWVEVAGRLTEILCGRSRPGHFRGVTTVVAKLFNIVGPCRAYFGQKDCQQAQVICRMVSDLFLPVEMRILPIVREPDGLALSSRNSYLSADERRAALVLSQSLAEAEAAIKNGEKSKAGILEMVCAKIRSQSLGQIDYVEIYGFPGLFEMPDQLSGRLCLAVAVKFGRARLIDNLIIDCP